MQLVIKALQSTSSSVLKTYLICVGKLKFTVLHATKQRKITENFYHMNKFRVFAK